MPVPPALPVALTGFAAGLADDRDPGGAGPRGVQHHDPADEWLAETGQQLDGLRRLEGADLAHHRPEDADLDGGTLTRGVVPR